MLKDEADVALANSNGAGVFAMKQHLAGVGRIQPGDYSQQRGFTRARRAEQRDQLAGFDMQADVVKRNEVAKFLADVSKLDTHAATLIARSSCYCFTGTTRHSSEYLATSVTMASKVSSDETAKAAANW